jgi:mono/diheme cytochrome c family protein
MRPALIAVAGCAFGLAYATPGSAAARANPEIREVVNPTYAIQDRCMTCHAASVEGSHPTDGPVAESFHTPALLTAHPVAEMGCSVCHGGDPLATQKESAHGLGEGGGAPLFVGLHAQSRCVRCHRDTELPGAEFLERGLALIDDRACFACHEISGGEQRERIAPTLGNIATKVHPEWIVGWLTDPNSYFSSARMPYYYLTEEQALAITSYLVLSLSEPVQESPREARDRADKLDRAEARRLLKQSACLDCHRMRGTGGSPGIRAPDLSHIGDKVRVSWLVEWLQGPQHLQPGAGMPGFRFTEAEATTLARYLTETFATRSKAEEPAKAKAALDSALSEEGKSLVTALGCMNCHGGPDERPAFKPGPDLRCVGDRNVRGLYWETMGQDWNMRLESYLRTKVSTPRAFSEKHIMPNFRFAPDEVEAIVVALMSYSNNPVPEASRFRLLPDEPALEPPTGATAAVFQRYQCLVCHALRGRFGNLAPDLGWEGDKVNRDWLVDFLKEPYLIRPAINVRMPNFGMTDEEVQLAADFIESTWWDDEVPPDPFSGQAPDPELVEQGKELFVDEYSCLDCHVVGDEGEIDGPTLSGVGYRLQPGWIYQWILDPQRFYANDMDDPEVTPEDALAITAYLVTLRDRTRE